MSDVFLSFSTGDTERVRLIRDLLVKEGLAVFWAHDIPPGTARYQERIEQELSAAGTFVVVWTSQSVQSNPVRQECAQATYERKTIIQVLLDELPPIKIPFEAPYGSQKVQLIEWNGLPTADHWRRLSAAIASKSGLHADAPSHSASPLRPQNLVVSHHYQGPASPDPTPNELWTTVPLPKPPSRFRELLSRARSLAKPQMMDIRYAWGRGNMLAIKDGDWHSPIQLFDMMKIAHANYIWPPEGGGFICGFAFLPTMAAIEIRVATAQAAQVYQYGDNYWYAGRSMALSNFLRMDSRLVQDRSGKVVALCSSLLSEPMITICYEGDVASRTNGTDTSIALIAPIVARWSELRWSRAGNFFSFGNGRGFLHYDAANRNAKLIVVDEGTSFKSSCCCWHPTSNLMARAKQSTSNNGHIRIDVVDLDGRDQNFSFDSQHSDYARTIAWSPDGRYLASAGDDYSICLSDLIDGATHKLLCTDYIYSLAFSPCGKRLVSSCRNKEVIVWGVKGRERLEILKDVEIGIPDSTWSPDSRMIALLSGGNVVVKRLAN